MTKDVLLTIKGLQYVMEEGADDERIETLNRGSFYKRNGKYFVAYEETPDGEDTVKSLIKFDSTMFELTKKGTYGAHMLFEEGKKNYSDYATPFGNLVIGVDTESITLSETDNEIKVTIAYDMEINYEHVARCNIDVVISGIES